jgi:hypothetical protein
MVDVFKGYNHNLRIGEGEFYDMKNMTSDFFPVLTPVKPRGLYASLSGPSGLIAKDSLCYTHGAEFVINGDAVDMELSNEPKQLISMGAYVIIMPDKKYINTNNLKDWGKIEAEITTKEPVSFSLCRLDGSEYIVEYTQPTAPEKPANMALWIDTSSEPHALRQWSEVSGMWVGIATCYVKISSPGIGKPFAKYDGINISGLKDTVLIDANTQEEIAPGDISPLEGAAIVWDKGDNYIVVVGMLDAVRTISNEVTITRKMPEMDFIVESENRLWGCRYGDAANGEIVNEIYASKLGDFKNWNCYMGLSTDSYTASVGTDGQFTGAITQPGVVLFFKENCIHKVYGNFPANFQIQTTMCRGVQKGCERSLAMVNEVVFYKAKHAVCAYDGSLPTEISGALGNVLYKNAVAGAHGNKYYISMEDMEGKWHLFVYDTSKGMWHKEDDLRADAFCSCREELYCIDHDSGDIITMLGSGEKIRGQVDWMVETGPIYMEMPDMKYLTRLLIRMSVEMGGRFRIFLQYDSFGAWELQFAGKSTSTRSFSMPIRPRRCDHFRLRIEGEGEARIYSMTKTIEQGSDIS